MKMCCEYNLSGGDYGLLHRKHSRAPRVADCVRSKPEAVAFPHRSCQTQVCV